MFSRVFLCSCVCILCVRADERNDSRPAPTGHVKRIVSRSVKRGNANQDFDGSLGILKMMFRDKEPIVTGPRGDLDYCNVTGLSTVFRSGDVTVEKEESGRNILQLNIGFGEVDMVCHHNAKFFVYTVGGGILTGALRNVTLYAKAAIDYDSEESTKIQQFRIVDPGQFDMNYNGKGLIAKVLGYFLKKLKPLASNRMHGAVLDTIEVMLHYHKEHLSYIGSRDDDDDDRK